MPFFCDSRVSDSIHASRGGVSPPRSRDRGEMPQNLKRKKAAERASRLTNEANVTTETWTETRHASVAPTLLDKSGSWARPCLVYAHTGTGPWPSPWRGNPVIELTTACHHSTSPNEVVDTLERWRCIAKRPMPRRQSFSGGPKSTAAPPRVFRVNKAALVHSVLHS
jgi:hypothetical protein